MEWIEAIQIKSFSKNEQKTVYDMIEKMTFQPFERDLKYVRVYLNHILDTDLTISFHWEKPMEKITKSPLGIQLVSAFSKFGWIHHTVWECALNIKINKKDIKIK